MPVSVPGHSAPRPPVPAPGSDQEWRNGVAIIQNQLPDDTTVQMALNDLLDQVDTTFHAVLAVAYGLTDADPQNRAMARAATLNLLRSSVEGETQSQSTGAATDDAPPPEPEPVPEQPPAEG